MSAALPKPYRLFWHALLLILSGLLWLMVGTCFYLSPWAAYSPVFRVIYVGVAISGIAILQWRLLRAFLAMDAARWVVFNALGLSVGFALGFAFAGREPQPISESMWLGWDIYYAKVFGVAGAIHGLAQWVSLRSHVRFAGWLCISGLVGGFSAGAFEGHFLDRFFITFGMHTATLLERFSMASLFSIPGAHVIFGLLTSSALALVLAQAAWQRRSR